MNAQVQTASLSGAANISAPSPLEVRVLRSVPEVEAIRGTWTKLLRHPNADIDLFLSEISSRPQIVRPHVILLNRDGIPDAILVGRLEIGRMDLRVGYARFFRPQARTLTFIYGGLLGNLGSDSADRLVREVLKCLRQGEAEVAFFNHMKADSPLAESLRRVPGVFSRDFFPAVHVHRAMDLPDNVEQLHRSLSRKVRKNQRWNKLTREYKEGIEIRCFQNPEQIEEMAKTIEEVAKTTYHRALGVGFSDSSAMRIRLRLKAEKGWLRAYVLYANGSPKAFWIGTLCQDVFHSDYMGYVPEFAQYSAGTYLVMKVIEGFCANAANGKVSALDFGLGDSEWKEHLANRCWPDGPVYIFAPSVRGLGLNAVRTPVLLVDRLARNVLERTKLIARVKKFWRNRKTTAEQKEAVAQASPSAGLHKHLEKPGALSAE